MRADLRIIPGAGGDSYRDSDCRDVSEAEFCLAFAASLFSTS